MELVRIKPTQCYSNVTTTTKHHHHHRPSTTNSILKSLQQDNILIKRKLKEIETRLTKVTDDQEKINASFNNAESISFQTLSRSKSVLAPEHRPSSSDLLDRIRERYAAYKKASDAGVVPMTAESRPKTSAAGSKRISSSSSSMNFDKILENLNKQRLNTSSDRKSIIIAEANENNTGEMEVEKKEETSGAIKKTTRPKTSACGSGESMRKSYRHMFYSGTWPRIHSELFQGDIDRLAPTDRNVVMFQDVRKKFPETFIFHPEWV